MTKSNAKMTIPKGGPDIHYDDDYALRWAADQGLTKTVKLLLDRGANIHAGNDDALRRATHRGRAKTVKLLLDRGADRSTI